MCGKSYPEQNKKVKVEKETRGGERGEGRGEIRWVGMARESGNGSVRYLGCVAGRG